MLLVTSGHIDASVNSHQIVKTRPPPTHPKGWRGLNLWLTQTRLHHEVCEVKGTTPHLLGTEPDYLFLRSARKQFGSTIGLYMYKYMYNYVDKTTNTKDYFSQI